MNIDLITIMMPVYNAERYIKEAIESVLAQSCQNWELIVIDDGSTDRTGEILDELSDPRIKVQHQPNQGEASARNAALDLVQGEYLAFLDADDVFLPQHLERTVGCLQEHLEWGGIYSDGFYIDQEGSRLIPLSSRRRGPFEGDIYEEVMRSSDVFGAPVCVILRTAIIKQHSLRFDAEIVIGPDWDFLTQYAEVATFGYLRETTCLYRVHQTNISLRTGQEKRLHSLALCREKTIRMSRFGNCSSDARSFVFYDLLINLLRGNPVQQAEIVEWEEFSHLMVEDQARLLRLMATRAIIDQESKGVSATWLKRARSLNPKDLTGFTLYALYSIHPVLCRMIIELKNSLKPDEKPFHPFADLMERKVP